jgi:hypothetical protein
MEAKEDLCNLIVPSLEKAIKTTDNQYVQDHLQGSTGADLQREILVQPHRADLWLSLAKLFVEKDDATLASEAASRASFMLSQELMNQQQDDGRSSPVVSAVMFSEAIALDVWLKETTNTSHDLSSIIELQRALMMDPGNKLVRLGLFQSLDQ